MFSLSYKGKQGKIVRWGMFIPSSVLAIYGAYCGFLGFPGSNQLAEDRTSSILGIPINSFYRKWATIDIDALGLYIDITPRLLIMIGVAIALVWLLAFLCFSYVKTSEFLINTEDEMRKVAWPTFQELVDSSCVVIIAIIIMGVFLFLADILLATLLQRVFY
jgi:preprotein translocase SecE subunit